MFLFEIRFRSNPKETHIELFSHNGQVTDELILFKGITKILFLGLMSMLSKIT